MAKEKPTTEELQVAFDLGDEPPDSAQASPAKKAQANPGGKLVKNRRDGQDAAGGNAKEKKAAKTPGSKPVSAAKDTPTISIAGEDGPSETPPEKTATPPPEQPMATEPAAGNGAEHAGRPPVEIPAGEEVRGEVQAGEEMGSEEMVSEEHDGEEMGSEEHDGEEHDGEEQAGEEPERFIQLINNQDGCWKVLSDGERVDLSDQEWRAELARHFKRETRAGG